MLYKAIYIEFLQKVHVDICDGVGIVKIIWKEVIMIAMIQICKNKLWIPRNKGQDNICNIFGSPYLVAWLKSCSSKNSEISDRPLKIFDMIYFW